MNAIERYNEARRREEEAFLRTPEGEAARRAHNAATLRILKGITVVAGANPNSVRFSNPDVITIRSGSWAHR